MEFLRTIGASDLQEMSVDWNFLEALMFPVNVMSKWEALNSTDNTGLFEGFTSRGGRATVIKAYLSFRKRPTSGPGPHKEELDRTVSFQPEANRGDLALVRVVPRSQVAADWPN